MPFAIEFSAESERDFELIFEHLRTSYIGIGETPADAFEHAARRVLGLRNAADRLAEFPMRGTAHDDILRGLRHLTIDRAIFWFDVDHTAKRVRILAVFFGGQDHVRHMLLRLLRHDEPE